VYTYDPAIMEAATVQIREIYANSNVRERQRIQEQIRDLQKDLYSDWETMFSLAMAVSLPRPSNVVH
jgi:demethylsterigmatocystin 6-O-methyltransferase